MTLLTVEDVSKTFTMHLHGGSRLPVLRGLSLSVAPGECVVLGGPSGVGKSSILKMIYGNYLTDAGRISVGGLDIATASPREVLAARRGTVGYVSQFLRCVPRVGALPVVAEPLIERGTDRGDAEERAAALLRRLDIPERLWALPPATFSGGEQQRVNIARGLIAGLPLLLLDEPTASLDVANRAIVVGLLREQLAAGVGMLAIFHDPEVREALADRVVDVSGFAP
ncbi:phosphonate C-P lyase system protein PhnL [Cryptosporangium phraense]|uniref:Phosphonate C-P lyase system protein PhnL n=1 Tax=Cryptosporangium phraense TaxID=2593070 RepID=A0A545ALA7_9ACTN|nr:phosphonate C-P lyase system protein PhnL [Cryptosporangium phraense]TQS42071.1 phosphonate C-P lyase system protein PhnL [Cryptosporangium phraense]